MPRLTDALEAIGLDGDAIGEFARDLGWARLPEDVALNHADAEVANQLEVVVRLNTLGAGIHAQSLGEGDDRADDRCVAICRGCRAADEALVDLDLVERRLLEIAERAVSGTEVVERQAHAQGLEFRKG